MRVLVTGLGTFWGGRLAQHLEADPAVELVVGVDIDEPKLPLGGRKFDVFVTLYTSRRRSMVRDPPMRSDLLILKSSRRMDGPCIEPGSVFPAVNCGCSANAAVLNQR